ncbi:MAG: hypothetical protein RLZZ546_2606 [Bacteroidota bacterium]
MTNITIIRTNSQDLHFVNLVDLLNKELAIRDGDDHAFYSQFNQIDMIKYVCVAMENDIPIGCGAIKQFDDNAMEIKRMFTKEEHRGKGIAQAILTELEKWTLELGYNETVLETGNKQPEAIALYRKVGYNIIPNYGQYEGIENSKCFKKILV